MGPQHAALAALSRNPSIDQRILGQLESLDRSSVTEIVRRLVSRGWVERHRDPGDGTCFISLRVPVLRYRS